MAAQANVINVQAAGKVQYRDKRLLVLFFDFSSMQPQEQIRAQEAALKFLAEQMTPSDMVSIMTLGATVQVAQDFTADRDRLTIRFGDIVVARNGWRDPNYREEDGADLTGMQRGDPGVVVINETMARWFDPPLGGGSA